MKKVLFWSQTWILVVLLNLLPIVNTFALPGDLDASFGSNGIASVDLGTDNESPVAVALQPDGKIIVVGNQQGGGPRLGVVARLNANGSLDPSFNGQGFQIIADPNGSDIDLRALALQSDGKIIAAGTIDQSSEDVFLTRLNADGSLDTGFGNMGQVSTVVSPSTDIAGGVALQSDGKIVIGGQSGAEFLAARYLPDGSLDPSFNDDGVALTDFDGANDFGRDVAVQEDDKIIVTGQARMGGAIGFGLVRYNPDGSLDTSFGNGGKVFGPPAPDTANAVSVKLQSNGNIVTGGLFNNGLIGDFGIARYLGDGSLDGSFGNNGLTLTPFGNIESGIRDMTIQEDGFIVACGTGLNRVALARYNTVGMLDFSFANDGTLTTDLGGDASCNGVALQSDGKIVIAAKMEFGTEDFNLIRYLGNTANLTLVKTSSHDTVGIGGSVGFSLTVANDGPNDAGGTWVLDEIPVGLILDPNSLNTNQGSCSADQNNLICDLGILANGTNATINYSVSTDTLGTFVNSASVTAQATNEDPNAASAAITITVTEAVGGCGLLTTTPQASGWFAIGALGLALTGLRFGRRSL